MTQQLDAAKARKFVENVFCAGYHHDPDKMIQESEWLPFVAELLTLACPPVPDAVRDAIDRLRRLNAGVELSQSIFGVDDQNVHTACLKVKKAIRRDEETILGHILSARGADVRAADCMECGTCHDCVMRTMEASHAAHLEEVKQEGERVVAAILSRLGDVIRRIGPARRPDDIKAALEAIYNEYAHQSARAILSAGRAGDEWRPIAEGPKDGTHIIIGWQGSTMTAISRWLKTAQQWLVPTTTAPVPLNQPTHFHPMPLPKPPLGIAAESAKGV